MRKIIYMILGFFFLILGAIGVLLPVLPTTPFVLLAGFFFVKSSPALYERLKHIPWVGEFISYYSEKTYVSRRTRIQTVIFLWVGLFFSMYVVGNTLVSVILVVIGVVVTAHIFLLPKDPDDRKFENEMIDEIEKSNVEWEAKTEVPQAHTEQDDPQYVPDHLPDE